MYVISFREINKAPCVEFSVYDTGLAYKLIQFIAEAYDNGDIGWFDFRPMEVTE